MSLKTVRASRVRVGKAECSRVLPRICHRCRASSAPTIAQSGASISSGCYDVVVVGAGISGLVTALALETKHSDVVQNYLVTEARDRVGGNITTCSDDSFLWEEGPNSFTPSDSVLEAAVDAGVADELVLGDPTAPRFVYWKEKLCATPSGPVSAVFGDFLSFFGKVRAGLGAIGLLKAPAPVDKEESVKEFITRNLGEEVFLRLIEPFCSGVYAGDPAKLSMKAAFGKIQILEEKGGSLVGGTLELAKERKSNPTPPRDPKLPPKPAGQTVGSFRKGLQTLPIAIADKLTSTPKVNWRLTSLAQGSDGKYQLTYDTPEGQLCISARTVALTVPAYTVGSLMESVPGVKDALAAIDYPPVCAVTLAYPLSAIKDERKDSSGEVPGFGQLHPRTQGVVTLGTIYSSSLFPGRCPKGMFLTLNYIGGATNRGILEQPEDEIVAEVDRDLRLPGMLLKHDAQKPQVVGVRTWPQAIPQFNVGHLDAVEAAKDALEAAGYGNVKLGGNYVSGVALGKCIEYGYTFAGEIAQSAAAAKL